MAAAAVVVIILGGLLYLQIKRNGELSATVDQQAATINLQTAALDKERRKSAETNLQLAESRKKVQQLQQSERELSHDLQASNDKIINARIPVDVAERVRQFRNSNN
ncbi:hypothetical protein [Aliamphritea hakodatensis]|uniref:hypothetical protein n=1 Tax=Aliamphritea hakodatensis TaxID=2895352 RepID=UPI0022FDA523|nr:hypothetical protein [Aliamphritea hakodatensis]